MESHALQMDIMQDLRMIGDLPLVSVLSMEITSYHGKVIDLWFMYFLW